MKTTFVFRMIPVVLLAATGGAVPRVSAAERQAAAEEVLAAMRQELAEDRAPAAASVCEIARAETGPHRAHGPKPLDYKRRIVLRNENIEYGFNYWMNAENEDGGAPLAIEGTSGLGMDRPSAANWYANNFLEFDYGGEPLLKTALARFEPVEAEGGAAGFRALWNTNRADVVLTVKLAPDAACLDLRLEVTAKDQPKPVTVGFRAYPGHYPEPRNRRVATRKRVLEPVQVVELGAEEQRIVLFDEAEADSTACGIDATESGQKVTRVDIQDYGVTVKLEYTARPHLETGLIRLWDLKGVSVNSAMDAIFAPDP